MAQVGLPAIDRRTLRCPTPSAEAVTRRTALYRYRHKKAPVSLDRRYAPMTRETNPDCSIESNVAELLLSSKTSQAFIGDVHFGATLKIPLAAKSTNALHRTTAFWSLR